MTDETQGWAKPVTEITGAAAHLEGRKLTGPQQGFGPLWQKTYAIDIPGHEPTAVVSVWKEHYGDFWPFHSRFNAPLAGIQPGEVGSISTMKTMSTGVIVMYADDTSFAFMTPEGHPFAGWITFSASASEDGSVAQIQLLIRPNDPIWDLGFTFGFGKGEDAMWRGVLKRLAEFHGATGRAREDHVKVDRKRIWSNSGNWKRNALIPRRRR